MASLTATQAQQFVDLNAELAGSGFELVLNTATTGTITEDQEATLSGQRLTTRVRRQKRALRMRAAEKVAQIAAPEKRSNPGSSVYHARIRAMKEEDGLTQAEAVAKYKRLKAAGVEYA